MTDNPRLVSPEKRGDDTDASIRPLSLLDFTGQEAARKNLKIFIEAAKARSIMCSSSARRDWARRRLRKSSRASSASTSARRRAR